MSAQTELKARAKKHLVERLSESDHVDGCDLAGITHLLSLGGYTVSRTSVRRYIAELVESGELVKDMIKEGNWFAAEMKKEAEEVAEPVLEEPAAEENIEEVDDGKIIETVRKLSSEIIRSGKTASFTVEMKDGSSKTYACNNLERLDSVITKIIPDESLVSKVEVCEATAATVPSPSQKTVEKKPEVQEEKKKGGRTKKSEPVAKEQKEPKTKPAKPAKPSKYTRAHALADVLKQSKLTIARLTKADLIMHSNNQYIGHGGKDNLKEAKWYFSNVVGILELMGTIRVDGEHVEVV